MSLCQKMILLTLSVAVFAFLLGGLDSKVLTVKKGEDATLKCHGPSGADIILLQWKNPSLHSDYYVFYYSDNQVHEEKQHELFKGRVQLRDPEMKDGDLSVILKNVSVNDAGMYECYIGCDKQGPQLMNSTTLKIEEPGPSGGLKDNGGKECVPGVIVGLLTLILLVLVV